MKRRALFVIISFSKQVSKKRDVVLTILMSLLPRGRANKQVRPTRQHERDHTGSGEEHTGRQHNYVTSLNFQHFTEAEG